MTDDKIHPDDREFRLSRYLDGELGTEDARRLERELEVDPGLRKLLDAYRRTARLVKDSADAVPEPDWDRFGQQVLWRCGAESARPRRAWYRLVAPLAAAAAITLAFTLYMRSNPPSAPTVVADVKVTRPDPSVRPAHGAPVVSVVFDRTPPASEPDPAEPAEAESDDEGSYVIAAAGARPLDDAADDEESTPTF